MSSFVYRLLKRVELSVCLDPQYHPIPGSEQVLNSGFNTKWLCIIKQCITMYAYMSYFIVGSHILIKYQIVAIDKRQSIVCQINRVQNSFLDNVLGVPGFATNPSMQVSSSVRAALTRVCMLLVNILGNPSKLIHLSHRSFKLVD